MQIYQINFWCSFNTKKKFSAFLRVKTKKQGNDQAKWSAEIGSLSVAETPY